MHPSIYLGRAGGGGEVSRGRPWLPRGGATALRGGATELMGDVIIFLLSVRQTNRQERQRWRKGEQKKKKKKKIPKRKG